MPCWSSITVGEANERDRRSRSCLWARAVFMPMLFLGMALYMASSLYRGPTVRREPWRLLVELAWAPYMTLGEVITGYMNLSLPLAPNAARGALLVFYSVSGTVLMVLGFVVAIYGHASAAVAFAFAFAFGVALLLAFWVWVDRAYRAAHDHLPR
ncbi:unnamed protein product [Urochloa decumbens]|uniref:DUF7378 domain-containing protein n=1 Tax=Urochloa decumbens TaxID=240449 RepID=A0ABC8WCE2_9POAL